MRDYRYERKFYILNKKPEEVEAIVKLHRYGFSEIFVPRKINNIYFDFHNLQNFYENVDGLANRKKHRVRWYGETFRDIKKPVLEIKIKKGLLGTKLSYPVNVFEIGSDFTADRAVEIFNCDTVPQALREELKTMRPMLLNSYERKYFMSGDGNYRITIDSQLQYYKILSQNNSFMHKCLVDNNVIMELKYANDLDDNVNRITSSLPFRVTKSSKYVEGIERLFGIL